MSIPGTGIFGMILPDLSHPFFSLIAEGAVAEARANGRFIIIASTEGRGEYEPEVIERMIRAPIDGLIYIPVGKPVPIPSRGTPKGLPIVITGRTGAIPGVPHVYSDGEKGGYIAAKHMIGLKRRHIGFLASFWEAPCTSASIYEFSKSPESTSYTTMDRFKGYVRALEEENIPYDQNRVVICGYSFEYGVSAAKELISRKIELDALLGMTSVVSAGTMDTFRSQDYRIPEDISIIVFEDGEQINLTHPRLTCVKLSLRNMGRESVRTLNRLLLGFPVENTMIDVVIKPGHSTVMKQ